jgi:hypothetical protein
MRAFDRRHLKEVKHTLAITNGKDTNAKAQPASLNNRVKKPIMLYATATIESDSAAYKKYFLLRRKNPYLMTLLSFIPDDSTT